MRNKNFLGITALLGLIVVMMLALSGGVHNSSGRTLTRPNCDPAGLDSCEPSSGPGLTVPPSDTRTVRSPNGQSQPQSQSPAQAPLLLGAATGPVDGAEPSPETGPAVVPVQNSGPVPLPSCGAYWGNYIDPQIHGGGQDADAKLAAMNNVEQQIGRKFDIDHQFYRWDDFVTDFNIDNYVTKSIGQGRIPFLSWKPVFRDGTNVSWRAIANGAHDQLIREKAAQVRSISAPVIIVLDHEANSRVGPYERSTAGSGSHIKANSGSEGDFVSAWRHVHDIFALEGVNNVSWAWIMSRTPFADGGAFADRMYPGDAYVDWVGVDPYNFNHGGKNWSSMESLMVSFAAWVDRRQITKPWILGEWGSVEDPNSSGRKGDWYRQTAEYFATESRLKAVVHFESNPGPNWRFDTSPSAKQGFIDASSAAHLNQTC